MERWVLGSSRLRVVVPGEPGVGIACGGAPEGRACVLLIGTLLARRASPGHGRCWLSKRWGALVGGWTVVGFASSLPWAVFLGVARARRQNQRVHEKRERSPGILRSPEPN